jgi:hypothetical protein
MSCLLLCSWTYWLLWTFELFRYLWLLSFLFIWKHKYDSREWTSFQIVRVISSDSSVLFSIRFSFLFLFFSFLFFLLIAFEIIVHTLRFVTYWRIFQIKSWFVFHLIAVWMHFLSRVRYWHKCIINDKDLKVRMSLTETNKCLLLSVPYLKVSDAFLLPSFESLYIDDCLLETITANNSTRLS